MKNQIFHFGKIQNLILKKGHISFWEIKLATRTTPCVVMAFWKRH